LRGRVGFAVDRALLYGTGGLAVANVKYADHTSDGVPLMNSGDATRAGWTAGGGIEWALNGNWTVKAEYLHVDLGNVSYNNVCSPAGLCATGLVLDHKTREDIARIGINYRFGGTMSAKY
jgi:outer membrane immunogenic protein